MCNKDRNKIASLSIFFFPASFFYHEFLLRVFDLSKTRIFDIALLRIFLFATAAGLFVFLVLDLLPWRKAARIIGGIVVGVGTITLCVVRGCRATFGVYYGISFMGEMAGNVAGDFGSTVVQVVLGLIPFILLSFIPLALFVLLRQSVIPRQRQKASVRVCVATMLIACQMIAYLLSILGPVKNYYTYEFTANTSIPHFGLLTSIRLEFEYSLFGTPAVPLDTFLDDPITTLPPSPPEGLIHPTDPLKEPQADVSQVPIPTGPNQLNIDFEALAEAEANETIQSMHKYFASLTPSEKNEYTGMFEGKNLILITAEAFSTAAIDKELTPTLYKLSHEGFVFDNFYQPDWTQSTVGGEFSVTTGLIPNWVRGKSAALISAGNQMPTTLAHLFGTLGYSTPAWHDHTYNYYPRDKYLVNFGYDYKGVGNGLSMTESVSKKLWPESDLEMMQETADSYIEDYVNNGKLFHAYYMTVSGHGKYLWGGNAMSRKHREQVEAKYPNLSEVSQAYLACNMELDLALEYLVDRLEAAGIADDTLIVMAGDHYPYLMVTEDGTDYYNELRGFEDKEGDTSRYHNTLLMWSAAIKEPIQVDIPCSSIDIVPTICNLFGLEYDSRLYSGRDIFATNYEPDQYSNCMPLVVFADNIGRGNSWITAAGTYECSTKTFTPSEGIEVDEDYVSRVNRLVAGKINYANLILRENYYAFVFGND